MDNYENKKNLPTAIFFIIGIVIGAGIYNHISTISDLTGSNEEAVMVSWLIGSILVLFTAVIFAKLASVFPGNGGIENYTLNLYGKPLGFIAGFFRTFVYFPLTITGLSFVAAYFTTELFTINLDESVLPLIFITFSYLIFFLTINLLTTLGVLIQMVGTIIKLIPVALIIITGLLMQVSAHPTDYEPFLNNVVKNDSGIITMVGLALVPILCAFDGFLLITTISDKIKNNKKNIPIAILISSFILVIIYLVFNLAIVNLAPVDAYAGGFTMSEVIGSIYNKSVAFILNIFIVISVLVAINGFISLSFNSPNNFCRYYKVKKLDFISTDSKENQNAGILMSILILATLAISTLFLLLEGSSKYSFLVDFLTQIPIIFVWCFYNLIFLGVILNFFTKKVEINFIYVIIAFITFIPSVILLFINLNNNLQFTIGIFIILFIMLGFTSKYSELNK